MLKGIRNLTDRDRLAARVVELEAIVEQQRAELSSRLLNQTTFHEVKRPFNLDSHVRDHVVERVVQELSPMFEPHILRSLKDVSAAIQREDRYRMPSYHAAMADMRDVQIEVALPALTTSFRVAGVY